jgi:hypothetical protein
MKVAGFYCLLTVVIPLCVSCAASAPAVKNTAAGTKTQMPSRRAASLEESFDSGHWVTMPSADAITIIGVTGRRANRDEAVREALADAARKAALYHGVRTESAAVLNQGSGFLDYLSDFDYRIDLSNNYEAYIDALVFDEDKDILEKNGLVIVRTRYTGRFDVPSYESGVEDGIPLWVKTYSAGIPGFLAGVGYSRNKGTLQKTYTASYETALVSLLPQLSTRISNEVIDSGGAKMTSIVTSSKGEFLNVMILETWFDKKTSSVWTLVAARGKN